MILVKPHTKNMSRA